MQEHKRLNITIISASGSDAPWLVFNASCIELQLHSNSTASSPSLPFEPELHSLWNVTTDLKREKCIEQHDKLRIESSQLWRAGKCFALVVENLRVINDVVKACERTVSKVDYFGESNWGTVWMYINSRYRHTYIMTMIGTFNSKYLHALFTFKKLSKE